jgi:hypothetical protein
MMKLKDFFSKYKTLFIIIAILAVVLSFGYYYGSRKEYDPHFDMGPKESVDLFMENIVILTSSDKKSGESGAEIAKAMLSQEALKTISSKSSVFSELIKFLGISKVPDSGYLVNGISHWPDGRATVEVILKYSNGDSIGKVFTLKKEIQSENNEASGAWRVFSVQSF